MTWTYKPEELDSSLLFQVRSLIGDVEEDDPLLQDEEILFALEMSCDDVIRAAISCCDSISARFLKQSNFKLGPYSVDLSRRSYAYKSLARELRNKLASSGGPIWTGSREASFDVGMMRSRRPKEEV